MIVTELTIAEIRAVIADMRVEAARHSGIASSRTMMRQAERDHHAAEAIVNAHWANRLEAVITGVMPQSPG